MERSEERALGYREEIAALQEEAERFREIIGLLEADNESHGEAKRVNGERRGSRRRDSNCGGMLGDQFCEINRRQFAEAEVVTLKGEVEDLELRAMN